MVLARNRVRLHRYHDLMQAFASGTISAPEFEDAFLELYRSGSLLPFGRHAKLVDKLMLEVDAFCADPELRDQNDIDADALKAAVQKALDSW